MSVPAPNRSAQPSAGPECESAAQWLHLMERFDAHAPLAEFLLGAVGYAVNLLFCLRFVRATKWHANFRVLFVAHNFVCGVVSVSFFYIFVKKFIILTGKVF